MARERRRIGFGGPVMRNALAYAGAILIAAILGVVVAAVPHLSSLPPCETEDSVNCYWDADTMGNGRGKSYTSLYIAGSVIVIYSH